MDLQNTKSSQLHIVQQRWVKILVTFIDNVSAFKQVLMTNFFTFRHNGFLHAHHTLELFHVYV